MAVPTQWDSAFRYLEHLAVLDVQTIIDDLYVELVTNGGWTCTLGGTGQTPTTYQSPARADGLFFTLNLTRTTITRLQLIMKDHSGVLVNAQTSTKQDIDALGTTVHLYTGPFHVCINTERATPECFACGIGDTAPETMGVPRATYWATVGPRNDAGTWSATALTTLFAMNLASTAYAYAVRLALRCLNSSTRRVHASGSYLVEPAEIVDSADGYLLGRIFQAALVPDTFAWAAEVTAPIDTGATGVFKVVGSPAGSGMKMAFRKA